MKLRKFTALTCMILLGGLIAWVCLGQTTKRSQIAAEIQEEIAGHPLAVSGNIPSWLSGTLIRNGPIKVTIDGQSNVHWFDGLAMLHAFSFQEGKVVYSNKFLRTDAYRTVFEEGSLQYGGFAADPCRSLFKRFVTLFVPAPSLAVRNANVNVTKLANEYVALTETPLPVKFDAKTLDTLGVLDYQDELPKGKCWESAHPHYDTREEETINYLIQYGQTSYYTLYRLQEGVSQRDVIANVPVDLPAYMHSFALTEQYVIFTEFPFVVKPLDLLAKGQPFIHNFSWHPERGTQFIVVDRHSGDIVGQYTTRPFFAFHHANAFEEGDVLHIDMVTYEDANIIAGNSLHVNSDGAADDDPSRLERFSLDLNTGEITSDVLLSKSHEFPRINEAFDGQPYRYVYVAGFSDIIKDPKQLDGETLYKVNTGTKEFLTWREKGCSPGEPVFVAAPNAKEEDEGVVLAVILDRPHNDSFLLILDGQSFQEIGRARAPHSIPAGFHGQHFPLQQKP